MATGRLDHLGCIAAEVGGSFFGADARVWLGRSVLKQMCCLSPDPFVHLSD
jgi:hypothetical protein